MVYPDLVFRRCVRRTAARERTVDTTTSIKSEQIVPRIGKAFANLSFRLKTYRLTPAVYSQENPDPKGL